MAHTNKNLPVIVSKPATSFLISEENVPRMMPRILGTWDMSATFIVCIYLASCMTTAITGGPAAISYLLLAAATFFLPCLVATAQLARMFPYEGALYNWTHRTLGSYWGFFAGFCAWFPGMLISSSLAMLFVSYLQSQFHVPFSAPWQQGLAICAILIMGGFVCTWRFRVVQHIINALVFLLLVASLLIGLAGALWLLKGHPSATNFSDWSAWSIRPDNFALFGLLAFAFLGTTGSLNLAGEIRGQYVIKKHLFWGALLIFAIYLSNIFALLAVQGRQSAYNPAALVGVVDTVLGKDFGYVTAVCLLGSFMATILVYNYLYARLLFVGALDHRLPKSVGKLNKWRVPANAIRFQTCLAVVFILLAFVAMPFVASIDTSTDFSNEVYSISLAAAALVWTVSTTFIFINLVASYIHNPWYFRQQRVFPWPILWGSVVLGIPACILTIVDTLLVSWTPLIPAGEWWFLVGSLTLIFLIISAFSSMLARSEAAWQEIRDTMADTRKGAAYPGSPPDIKMNK